MADLRINDKKLWEELISKNEEIDVFFHPQYSEIFEKNGDGESCVAIKYKSDDNFILYPFLIRKIQETEYFDITSPYGYGGAYICGDNGIVTEFYEEFYDYCKLNNIVTEFVRFHLFQSKPELYTDTIKNTHLNLYVNTSKDFEITVKEYHRSVRKNIRRAQESGCEIVVDKDGAVLNKFYDIYIDTMKRNEASDYYFFKKEFFRNLIRLLNGNYIFFNVIYNKKIIATELVLFSKKYAYSFLGGTNSEFYEMRPNDFLKHKIIEWCNKNKIEKFILGGGYSKEDGIYKYKSKFTAEDDLKFYVGNKIISEDINKMLCESHREVKCLTKDIFYKKEYFPLYRS